MKNFISDNIKKCSIAKLYYLLVILGYTLTLFLKAMRPGVFATFLMLLIGGELLLNKAFSIKSLPDVLVVMYFVYHLLSVIWLTKAGYPVNVYVEEITASVLPMVFYFVGKYVKDGAKEWYKWYLIAMLTVGLLGLVLYVFAPQFYNDWSYEWLYISKADAQTTRVRMNSVVGSTCLSFITVAGMLAGSFFLGKGGKDTQDAKAAKKDTVFGIVCIVLCLLFAILSNQRSGLVAAGLVIVYINYLLFFQLHLIKKKYFWFELIAVCVIFALICVVKFDFVLKFWWRIISLPDAIGERSEQWIAAVNNMYSTWLGNGLGANGHKALFVEGAHVIADGGLVKIYCEDGVIGFSMFVFLIILIVKEGIKKIPTCYVEIGIIAIAILQSIGSNMLALQLCTPIFWFAIGKIAGGIKNDSASLENTGV